MWSKAFAGNLAEFHSSTPSCEKRWWREYHVVRRLFSSRDMETCEDTKQHRRFSKNISECKSEATIQYMKISYTISYNYLKVHSCSHIHLIKFEMTVKKWKKKNLQTGFVFKQILLQTAFNNYTVIYTFQAAFPGFSSTLQLWQITYCMHVYTHANSFFLLFL